MMAWDFFGGLFDLNGDGETDLIEEAIGFSVLNEMTQKEEEEEEDH